MQRQEMTVLQTKTLTPEACVADEPFVHLGRADIDVLKKKVRLSSRFRTRLCAHKTTDDRLHEMFVVYLKNTYIRPNKHIGKDESLHILEGAADFVFFDEKGKVIEVVPLGDYASGRQFFCRIPQPIYHSFIMRSDSIIIHEATPGPFNREDTVYADWAPEEGDAAGIEKFMKRVEADSKKLLAGWK